MARHGVVLGLGGPIAERNRIPDAEMEEVAYAYSGGGDASASEGPR